jgi:translation initiation factor 1A
LKHEDGNENERELVLRTDDQEYGLVMKVLGSQEIEAMCFDGETRIAHIGGKMCEQVWIRHAPIATAMAYRHQVAIEQGEIVLLALRNFQEYTSAQVILKYTADETLRSGSCYSRLRGVRSLCLAVCFQ